MRLEPKDYGRNGIVDEVMCNNGAEIVHYARKIVKCEQRIPVEERASLKRFLEEIKLVKLLGERRHLVQFVGSYTDLEHMAIIMSPVAETDLLKYLAVPQKQENRKVRSFFDCLASALHFLHSRNI
jgi:serine/threonine protein kinase